MRVDFNFILVFPSRFSRRIEIEPFSTEVVRHELSAHDIKSTTPRTRVFIIYDSSADLLKSSYFHRERAAWREREASTIRSVENACR